MHTLKYKREDNISWPSNIYETHFGLDKQLEKVLYSQMASEWNSCVCNCESRKAPSIDRGLPEMDIKNSKAFSV